MNPVKPFDANRVASALKGHLADAVGDVASALLEFPDDADKWTAKIRTARRRRVADLRGWLADELYNDPDTISDLIGDRLHEECGGDKTRQLQVIAALEQNAFPGMRAACKTLRSFCE